MARLLFIFFIVSVSVKAQGVICLLPTDTTCNKQYDAEQKKYYCSMPDKQPEFKGGNSELLNYIMHKLVLPKDSMCEYYTIKVMIEIQSDGTPNYLKLLKPKNCLALDAEMQRIINAMPKWKPGQCKGQAVDSRLVLPIKIKLQ